MSSYFETFPRIFYLFGNEQEPVLFQQLNRYSDLIDEYRDNIGTYIEYEIRDGDRPHHLSQRFYGRPDYDWTFFLMNDRLRETGWPLSMRDLYTRATGTFYTNYTAKLDVDSAGEVAPFANLYPVGQSVIVGAEDATVVSKNLSVGEITLSSQNDIRQNTSLSYQVADQDPLFPETVNATLTNTVYEYEGTHHYVDGDEEWVDRFFNTEPFITPVTNLDHLIAENELSKKIRIIKKEYIEDVVGKMKAFIRNDR